MYRTELCYRVQVFPNYDRCDARPLAARGLPLEPALDQYTLCSELYPMCGW